MQTNREKKEEMHKTKAVKQVCYLRTLKEHFWLRWKEEYLLELRNSHRQTTKRQKESCIRVGDIVVIHDEKVRRVQWKLGRVEKLIEGKDGAIRGAVVRKLTDKTEVCTEIRRPVQKLYPVELSDGCEENSTEGVPEKDDQRKDVRRVVREAARKAQTKRKELIFNKVKVFFKVRLFCLFVNVKKVPLFEMLPPPPLP